VRYFAVFAKRQILSLPGLFVDTPHLPQTPLVQITRHPEGTAYGLFLRNLDAYNQSMEAFSWYVEIM
jgi:hypothetical protein